MITTAALALTALVAVQQTDTLIAARGLDRLDLENDGGQVVITTWDRDEIRVRAEHSSRTFIEFDRRGGVLQVEAEAERGPTTIVDYELTVPTRLNLNVEGMFTDVTIEGSDGEIEVETLEGEIRITGGRGTIVAESTNGEITVDGAEGSIEVNAVSRGIEITNSSGEIMAESVGGSIIMRGITASVVEVGTVGGRIHYEGSIQDGGHYFFGSHGGRVTLELPPNVNATVTAVSLTGAVRADYPGAPTQFSRRERESFTLGTGSAQIEAETFSGSIIIGRQGGGGATEGSDARAAAGSLDAAALGAAIADGIDTAELSRRMLESVDVAAITITGALAGPSEGRAEGRRPLR